MRQAYAPGLCIRLPTSSTWGTAGYVNTAVRKVLNASSSRHITTLFTINSLWRLPNGQTNPAAVCCVPAAGSKNTLVAVVNFVFVIAETTSDHVQRLRPIVDVRDLNLLRLFAGQLLVTQEVVLQTID